MPLTRALELIVVVKDVDSGVDGGTVISIIVDGDVDDCAVLLFDGTGGGSNACDVAGIVVNEININGIGFSANVDGVIVVFVDDTIVHVIVLVLIVIDVAVNGAPDDKNFEADFVVDGSEDGLEELRLWQSHDETF
ncbi:hypothetical protein NDU88_008170 [Pleurodeles waltl]|uniref:Uncharacterized protein n=1 Tax=Pleurodeles waltl TaxID=8319 RepID=A0AAV7RVA2_PLEWA|nr:hypothetical protein NDU88_008170 [Pleurodeles waltl]